MPHPRATLILSLSLAAALPAFPQAAPSHAPSNSADSAASNDEGPAGIIPAVKGPNLSLGTTSQHDSSNGWSSLLTPNFAWRFNKHFSADAGAPIFDYINVVVTKGTKAVPIYTNATKHFVIGDTALSGHFTVDPDWLSYVGTVTVGLPSGNSTYGLGAGQVTYGFNNHIDHSFGIFSPDIEAGIGDSSSLVNSRVRKSYTSVGTIANFQAGVSIDLPFRMNFDTEAYEELPVSSQTLFSTTGKGKKKVTTATSASLGEDNGFSNSLDIPLNGHVTLSGFYNRSLRAHIDTAGFSFTFILRVPQKQ